MFSPILWANCFKNWNGESSLACENVEPLCSETPVDLLLQTFCLGRSEVLRSLRHYLHEHQQSPWGGAYKKAAVNLCEKDLLGPLLNRHTESEGCVFRCEWESPEHLLSFFLDTLHYSQAANLAIQVVKGIENFPQNNDRLEGTIDIWWIMNILPSCSCTDRAVSVAPSCRHYQWLAVLRSKHTHSYHCWSTTGTSFLSCLRVLSSHPVLATLILLRPTC